MDKTVPTNVFKSKMVGQRFHHNCQGLAGPWFAWREHGSVKARFSGFKGMMAQMRTRVQTRQKLRGNNGLQEVDEDKTKVQLQLLPDTYS